MQFEFILNSIEGTLFEGQVDLVALRSELGQMELLPGHTDLAAPIDYTKIVVHKGKHEEEFFGYNGFVFFDNKKNIARVMLHACSKLKEMDFGSAKELLVYLESKLQNKAELNEYQIKFFTEEYENLKMVLEIEHSFKQDL